MNMRVTTVRGISFPRCEEELLRHPGVKRSTGWGLAQEDPLTRNIVSLMHLVCEKVEHKQSDSAVRNVVSTLIHTGLSHLLQFGYIEDYIVICDELNCHAGPIVNGQLTVDVLFKRKDGDLYEMVGAIVTKKVEDEPSSTGEHNEGSDS